MDLRFCSCKQCKKKRTSEGKVLWHRLLRHYGSKAFYVSDYVLHPKFRKGKRVKCPSNSLKRDIRLGES